MTAAVSRPKPIADAVKYVGSAVSALLGLGNYLLSLNLISSEQADQVANLGDTITYSTPVLADSVAQIVSTANGLVTAVTGLIASFAVAKVAESKVTPIESPMSAYGERLAPITGPVA